MLSHVGPRCGLCYARDASGSCILILLLLLAVLTAPVVARRDATRLRLTQDDLAEITHALFPAPLVQFYDDDTWTSLGLETREAWTFANSQFGEGKPHEAALRIFRDGMVVRVPIRVVLVLGSGEDVVLESLPELESAMTAKFGNEFVNVAADFKIEVASPHAVQSVRSVDSSNALLEVLQSEYDHGPHMAGVTVLFVVSGFENLDFHDVRVHIGKERMMYAVDKEPTALLRVLTTAERAIRQSAIPDPTYFPLAFVRHLRIEVLPFTPNHEHRAPWLAGFEWNQFEESVRSYAALGETIGFFASQDNSQCDMCDIAFRDLDLVFEDRGAAAARQLASKNHGNSSWARSRVGDVTVEEPGDALSVHDPFRIYVIDTTKVWASGSDSVRALENMTPAVYPGEALLFLRSSNADSIARMHRDVVDAILSGVYGVVDPRALRNVISSHSSLSAHHRILADVVNRNVVASLVAIRINEAVELLQALEKYDVDPVKALGDHEYAEFTQRLNLLIYRLRAACFAMSTKSDTAGAIQFAFSATHDLRHLRSLFGLERKHNRLSAAALRSLRVRCHFSRFKRGALVAGELIGKGGLTFQRGVFHVAAYIVSTCVGVLLCSRFSNTRSRLKQI